MAIAPNQPQQPVANYQPLPAPGSVPVYSQPLPPGAETQSVPTQPVYVQVPAVAPTAPPQEMAPAHPADHEQELELIIYSHSNYFYWWPVWVVGFLMAALTRLQGELVTIGGVQEWFHPSKNVGILFTITLLLVILFTNGTMRGKSSVIAILAILFTTVLFAYMGWWEVILLWLPYLSVHMNFGFYVVFSSLTFLAWLLTVFVFDHLRYWRVRPGQMTQEVVIGGASKSYDTRGMEFEREQQDIFRHWFLGLGSGDIRILTAGSHREEFVLTNVLFVGAKVREIQRLIAVKPGTLAEEPK